MERNPYQPPSAALEEPSAPARPAIGWRLYSGFLILATCAGYAAMGVAWFQAADGLDVLVTAATLIGLWGYAFQRRIGATRFWRQWLPIAVIWDTLYQGILTRMGLAGQYRDAAPPEFVDLLIVAAILIPAYVGLYRYGYRSDTLWGSDGPH